MLPWQKITVYTVVNKNDPNVYLTITNTAAEAKEYFNKWARIHWAANFKTYCAWSKDENLTVDELWQKFIAQDYVLQQFSDYVIFKLKFKKQMISSVMRMFNGCQPVGASYELPFEIAYYQQEVLKNGIE